MRSVMSVELCPVRLCCVDLSYAEFCSAVSVLLRKGVFGSAKFRLARFGYASPVALC
jgi:hypothetical protein